MPDLLKVNRAYRAIDNATGGIIIAPEGGLPSDKEVEGGRTPSEPSSTTAVVAADVGSVCGGEAEGAQRPVG